MTTTLERPTAPPGGGDRKRRMPGNGRLLLGVLVVWVLGWAIFQGTATLEIGGADLTDFHLWLNSIRDGFDQARAGSFFFEYVIGGISAVIDATVTGLRDLLSQPSFPRPVPEIGWLGVVAIFSWLAYALAGLRSAVMVLVGLLLFGFLGYWEDSIDLLIVTLVAVLVCVVIGIPMGIWMARSRRATAVLTPILDAMQTMPSFAYLAPLVLLFGIGPASAVVTTLIYALPPLARITAHGIRSVSPTTIEAARSMGTSRWQILRTVQLPMARRTIIVGLNQCTMAALSMATIAALINGPGLGQPVAQALQSLDIGNAFVSGIAIVIMAIVLDRTTTAASERAEVATRRGGTPRSRRIGLIAGGVVALVCVYLSRLYIQLAQFPAEPDLGTPLAAGVTAFTDALVRAVSGLTSALTSVVSTVLLNPLQSLLAGSPWWLMFLVLLAVAYLAGGWRPTAIALVCLLVILGTGLWNEAMKTLTTTIVATLAVILVALVIGVWMGRNRRADTAVRPILDAFQTIPPFVYLVPALALFGPTRFTAIVAAVAFGVPVATKLIADGIRGVSPTSVEAARASGTTAWQMISRVQLPMARAAVVLASNQGLLNVLSMVVIGGLVGGGGLGYYVVAGFSQGQLFGKGLAAGIAITALGIMLDRVAQYAAARYGRR
ncbi:ABC transporter permease [Pseudonocardia charpentierae]|uniref:ABC transporter permease subunit n=1 Tax=Pseudonocardia charpentierae TaxID=3075545 RepID=A0ABU2NH03_9PSEU|nr:ABC transporter permease subunit [Pseudonocardia sp. DSM 45834]MDT0353179.1 ABC transporter permease subunit [Pseudonocardia sp. DSM 45834]